MLSLGNSCEASIVIYWVCTEWKIPLLFFFQAKKLWIQYIYTFFVELYYVHAVMCLIIMGSKEFTEKCAVMSENILYYVQVGANVRGNCWPTDGPFSFR
jgi:hypothetical protein